MISKVAKFNYEKIQEKVDKNYGTEHLCGNCRHMMKCERMKIQNLVNKEIKKKLLEKLDFIKHYELEDLRAVKTDRGFIAIYECDNFAYEEF